MAPGRSLVISLARRAAQIHQYSVFPPSAPCTSERFVKCPQRGKVSPHGGRDPPALIRGLMRSCGTWSPVGESNPGLPGYEPDALTC